MECCIGLMVFFKFREASLHATSEFACFRYLQRTQKNAVFRYAIFYKPLRQLHYRLSSPNLYSGADCYSNPIDDTFAKAKPDLEISL